MTFLPNRHGSALWKLQYELMIHTGNNMEKTPNTQRLKAVEKRRGGGGGKKGEGESEQEEMGVMSRKAGRKESSIFLFHLPRSL